MSNTKETTAWAVVSPEGEYVLWAISDLDKESAINIYINGKHSPFRYWEYLEVEGYTCIEVTITPKEKV
jgi:hypothetical protein